MKNGKVTKEEMEKMLEAIKPKKGETVRCAFFVVTYEQEAKPDEERNILAVMGKGKDLVSLLCVEMHKNEQVREIIKTAVKLTDFVKDVGRKTESN